MSAFLRSLSKVILLCIICWTVLIVCLYDGVLVRQKESEKRTKRHLRKNVEITCNERKISISDKDCLRRFKWVKTNWKNKKCFGKYGIVDEPDYDESLNCSTLKYLKYVERVCPHVENPTLVFDKLMLQKNLKDLVRDNEIPQAEVRSDVQDLEEKLDKCGRVCLWIKLRIQSMKTEFMNSIRILEKDKFTPSSDSECPYCYRRKLTILLHMGLLTKEFGLNFGEGAFSGGPLGELVQWSDLMLGLHLLGHNVILSWSPDEVKKLLKPNALTYDTCKPARVADLVYTDIVGLEQIRNTLGSLYHYHCKLRILDVYGTEPEFNHPKYHSNSNPGQSWGGKGLNPRQFLTQFPHSPDNSFLGFVVVKKNVSNDKNFDWNERALIYGKKPETFYGMNKIKFLNLLPKYFTETHSTIQVKAKKKGDEFDLPDFIINHGSLPQGEFATLLRTARVYVGLGWPVEGPAALEAIANGVTYLNPKFDPPRHVYEGKPTSRRLASQNPYMEEFIGKPHVYTVDIKNLAKADEVLKEISSSRRPEPKVPKEFTSSGFLERLNAYLENQNFCDGSLESDVSTGITWPRNKHIWPVVSHLQVILSKSGDSCSIACRERDMICEPEYFPIVNQEQEFTKLNYKCNLVKHLGGVFNNLKGERSMVNLNAKLNNPECYAPSYDSLHNECEIQTDSLLFSCSCTPPPGIRRICPCRKFAKEQIALCEGCN